MTQQRSIFLVSEDLSGHTMIFSINGTRYEYKFGDGFDEISRSVEQLRRFSEGKALAYAKKHADEWRKL